jgi:hypothetical protein
MKFSEIDFNEIFHQKVGHKLENNQKSMNEDLPDDHKCEDGDSKTDQSEA